MVIERQGTLHQADLHGRVEDRAARRRRRQERALDEALENTFPASDPVSIEEPTAPATDRDRSDT
jgi:hypothetical protein